MDVPTIHLHVEAEDAPGRQWISTLRATEYPADVLSFEKDYVMMEKLVNVISKRCVKTWGGFAKYEITCTVKNNDDAGCLKPMLQDAIKNECRLSEGRY